MSQLGSRWRRGRSRERWAAGLALVLALAFGAAAALPGRAAAAPTEPTLGLAELETLLESGQVTGFFKTVDQGTHIARVPLTVLSIVGGAGPDGALIMFQADMADPLMQRIGTIAAGMSGSPLFVNNGGREKLIGALSYGDIFTLGGLALATPIEYMSAVETRTGEGSSLRGGATRVVRLAEPVTPEGHATVSSLIVTESRPAAEAARAAGAAVFAPLADVQIGGLPATSQAYSAVADALTARGHTVLRAAGSGVQGWDPTFTTPLVGGAALAAMYTRGDFWAGALGTVTYVNDPHVVAFGHPLDWVGPTSLYLCNAQIDGIWANSMSAYKLGTPGAVRGSITQDRGSAIAGLTGAGPAEVPVTSHATARLDGTSTASSQTWVAQKWADDLYGSYFVSGAASVAAYKAVDRAAMPGSAETSTTVVITDGVTQYTITRDNLWDDPYDVLWVTSSDISTILDTINANTDGIATAHIVSVDTDVALSDTRRAATVADVSVPGGLHAGLNTVVVTLNVNGQANPLDLSATLELPADMPLEGLLTVRPATSGGSSASDSAEPGSPSTTRLTLPEVVAMLNEQPTNNQIEISFTSYASEIPMATDLPSATVAGGTGEAQTNSILSTAYVVAGTVRKPTPNLMLSARPARVFRNQSALLSGTLTGVSEDATVRIYRRTLGQPAFASIAVVPVMSINGEGSFAYRTGRLRSPTVFKAVWDGNRSTLAATARVTVGIRKR